MMSAPGALAGRVARITGGSRGLSARIARELAAQGADVAFTDRQDRAAAERVAAAITQAQTSEVIRELVLKECAIKRLGAPEDVAPLVAFLCTGAARHITGQIIKADAGQYL
jgi:3-oxoacyl-[acyl-carrier protein] reductase